MSENKTWADCIYAFMPVLLEFSAENKTGKALIDALSKTIGEWTVFVKAFLYSNDERYSLLSAVENTCTTNAALNQCFHLIMQVRFLTKLLDSLH